MLRDSVIPFAFLLGWGSAQMDHGDYHNLMFGFAWMIPIFALVLFFRSRKSAR